MAWFLQSVFWFSLSTGLGNRLDLRMGTGLDFCVFGFGTGFWGTYSVGTNGGGNVLITFDFLLYHNFGTGVSNNDWLNDFFHRLAYIYTMYSS